jgi:tetratricopeptide (TPR) repeat protein
MRRGMTAVVWCWVCVGGFAGAAEGPVPRTPMTYMEVRALVARAEAGDCAARTEGLARWKNDAATPLAPAAWGRLMVVRSCGRSTAATMYFDQYRGFVALNEYLAAHGDDPQARVWRAASAVETAYVLWSMERAQADITVALAAYKQDPDLPDETGRCRFLLGMMAKDRGDLPAALKYWKEVYEAEPLSRAGAEAARMLALFTG